MENIIAQNEHVTLRELRTQISATSEGKLPTFKQLMEMKSAVVAQKGCEYSIVDSLSEWICSL